MFSQVAVVGTQYVMGDAGVRSTFTEEEFLK